uniref:Lysosomal Pro-X carboxypeptidase n=1 Tax=Syphacia muris TaxID=451379 RepID=A0A0N5AXL0_9BILA
MLREVQYCFTLEMKEILKGFMWDLAPQLSAAVIFAEHRFYGKTQPFGNESYTTVKHLGFLSSEQALADFAQLIQFLKENKLQKAKNSPVVAFGGSYGGMLAAWLRLKYPHIVVGSIAASAPVFWFPNTSVPENIYDHIVTRSFVSFGCVASHINKAWLALENLTETGNFGRKYLNSLFHLEQKSELEKPSDVGYSAGLTRPNWVLTNYGQWYPSASNIIFSNGYLDPWSGGGWSLVPKTTGTLVSIIIEDGAHHYDLRGSDPKDTEAVKDARRLETIYIKKWIKNAYNGSRKFIKKNHEYWKHA